MKLLFTTFLETSNHGEDSPTGEWKAKTAAETEDVPIDTAPSESEENSSYPVWISEKYALMLNNFNYGFGKSENTILSEMGGRLVRYVNTQMTRKMLILRSRNTTYILYASFRACRSLLSRPSMAAFQPETAAQDRLRFILWLRKIGEEGIEPSPHCWDRILSPERLPVPPPARK